MASKKRVIACMALAFILSLGSMTAKEPAKKNKKPVHIFKIDVEVKRTPVKDQYKTGTCWSFATISFLEAELLRLGRGEFDLAEMFPVRYAYPRKAELYVRHSGQANFDQGGQAHDVLDCMRTQGLVPESVYSGMPSGERRHNHGEMFALLKAMLESVLTQAKLSPRWPEAIAAVLDIYLGQIPARFDFQGKSFTPLTFNSEVLRLNPDDYIEITSYAHHPFYSKIRLEIPDNWAGNADYYNLPIDDMEAVMDHALQQGYSVVWDGDISEKEFSSRETGYGVVPVKEWEDKALAEQKAEITAPEEEKQITQEMRQQTFDNHTTTDDHLMHIVGLAHDQKGTKFYFTKNSGGTDRMFDGYVYLSRSYVRLKTMVVTVHRDSLPREIAAKLPL